MKHAIFLSVCWALIPTIPMLWMNNWDGILGFPYTDLYPSVWSLWAFSHSDWMHTNVLNYPKGMGWYPPSIIHAFIAIPLQNIVEMGTLYNILLIFFRFLCPLLTYLAARSWEVSHKGSLLITVVFACSPFCHGFAVEGIIEGLNAWTIPLWLYFCGIRHRTGMIASFALCCISNWYFGACISVMTIIIALRRMDVLWSFVGLFLVAPFVWLFVSAWSTIMPLGSQLQQDMSISVMDFLPNFTMLPTPLAKNNYISWIVLMILLFHRHRDMWIIFVPLLLSLNILGWLPLFEHIRFPYRFHAMTLLLVGYFAAPYIKKNWVIYAILIEQIMVGGLNFFIPVQKARSNGNYEQVDGPVLHLPGTFAMSPGVVNPARKRYQEILLAQMQHQQPLQNKGDFNSLEGEWIFDIWLQQDLLYKKERPKITDRDIETLQKTRIRYIAVHPQWLHPNTIQEIQHNTRVELISDQSSENLILFKVLDEDF